MNQKAQHTETPEARALSPAWSDAHDVAAAREGWCVSDSNGSENGRWQAQRIDDPAAYAQAAGFTPPALDSDDDAFRIVANGTEEHHVAARALLKAHNPTEFAAVLAFAQAGYVRKSSGDDGGLDVRTEASTRLNGSTHPALPPVGTDVKVKVDGRLISGVVTGHGTKDRKPTFDFQYTHVSASGDRTRASKWAWPEQIVPTVAASEAAWKETCNAQGWDESTQIKRLHSFLRAHGLFADFVEYATAL